MNETEKIILQQELDIRRKLAGETDNEFASNTRCLMPFLPSRIQKEANELIDGATLVQAPSFQELFYITIVHDIALRQAGTYRDFLREVFKIINEQPKIPTIIADGDCASIKFTRSSIINSRLRTLSLALEYAGLNYQTVSKGKESIDGYQNVIVDFLSNNPGFRAAGVDSTTGQVIGTFDMFPELFASRQTARMVRLRLGVEARTRLSLNLISKFTTNKRVIFFQGKDHKNGVEEWGKRNSVELKTMAPPSTQAVKPIFFNYDTRQIQK